jgi:hypothetical protein
MKKKIYIFSPDIKWKTFKKVWDMFPDTSGGPTPEMMISGKPIYSMIKNKDIIVGINENEPSDPVFFATGKWLSKIKNFYIIK